MESFYKILRISFWIMKWVPFQYKDTLSVVIRTMAVKSIYKWPGFTTRQTGTERLRLRQVYSTQHDIIQMHDIRHTWQFLCIIQY